MLPAEIKEACELCRHDHDFITATVATLTFRPPIRPRYPVCMQITHTHMHSTFSKKVKFSHTRYRALGPELIPVYRQSARR